MKDNVKSGTGRPDAEPALPRASLGLTPREEQNPVAPQERQAAEEFFDVVNERDEPIGRASRREVHARGLWHRAVHILVFNAAGQLFLQKRSLTKDASPGLWTLSCSGHVDAGEGYDCAAQRELGEELGLQLAKPPERWRRIHASAILGWEFSWLYRVYADGPFVLHPEEIECGAWRSIDEIKRSLATEPEIYCPGFRWIWAQWHGSPGP